jgi:hypothetical protein
MTLKDLSKELEYVKVNKNHLLLEHRYKHILVHDGKLIASFDSFENAANEGIRLFGIDANFLVQYITDIEPLNFIMAAL